nr:hypothetical protein [Tanacetum cinerariifolium]
MDGVGEKCFVKLFLVPFSIVPFVKDEDKEDDPEEEPEEEEIQNEDMIADVDDVPIPPVIQFGSNFHIGESSAMRDLLAGNREVYAPSPMCYDLKSVHRGVMKLIRENRSENSKMMKMITGLSREFTELKNQNRKAEELSRWEAWFYRTEGVVGLVSWFEKIENTFEISECVEGKKVKFATATLHGRALTWWNSQEVQRLEDELRHLKLRDMNIAAYTERFNGLALLYIKGLSEIIKGETTSSRPATLNEAVRVAHALMEQKIQAKNERIAERIKRKWENNNQGNNNNNNSHNRDDAEVINPYEEADPHNRPPPTSDEETEFAPPVVQIANVDDVPIPPVIQFGSNFHIGESSAMRDLLASNREVYAPSPMCYDLKSVHRGVMKLSKQMHDMYKTEKKMARKLVQDELRMNGQEFDITALDSAVRENRSENSKMMKMITGLSKEFTELKNQHRKAKELSRAAMDTQGDKDVDTDAPCVTQPFESRGSLRVVGLVRWFEKIENTFEISECAEGKKVKFATATLHGRALTWWNSQVAALGRDVANGRPWTKVKQKMTDEFCPTEEVQRLEDEMRHLKLRDMNIAAYTERFNELALLYIKGLPEIIIR